MSSEIQFGDLEQSQPQRALRPDQDAHFATCPVGKVEDHELLIFVDLDVMRDMEAHALSNTRVELGGVMLGKQSVDDQGRPFVNITDSLRAEHYEATKGSFKFTHETWSQISRQREEFRPELEMVGWYHTHPGWSVFLSGMDLFICNNFFNRPLDVALVIDPCEQDRGWFQWTDNKTTQRTAGFVLTTGRFRQQELDQFARIYNKEPIMNMDPRYSGNPINGAQPSVTYMDNRKPIYELAILGMLLTQFLLFSILAWKFLSPAGSATTQKDQQRIVELEEKLSSLNAAQDQTTRERAYSEVLSFLVESQTGDANLVDEFSNAKVESRRLAANLDGQMALAEKLEMEKNQALIQLQLKTNDSEKLESQLVRKRDELEIAEATIKSLKKSETEEGEEGEEGSEASLPFHWSWLAIGGLVTALLGSALGYAMGRREEPQISTGGSRSDKRDYRRESEEDFPPEDSGEIPNPDAVHASANAIDFEAPDPANEAGQTAHSLKIDGRDA